MTQADYEAAAEAFKQQLQAIVALPLDQREWPEEWLMVHARAHCASPGCPGALGIELDVGENADGVYRARCGYCRSDIANIALLFDDGEAPGRTS